MGIIPKIAGVVLFRSGQGDRCRGTLASGTNKHDKHFQEWLRSRGGFDPIPESKNIAETTRMRGR